MVVVTFDGRLNPLLLYGKDGLKALKALKEVVGAEG